MKQTIALVLTLLCLTALTAAGSGGDPLISRSYLEGDFLQSLEDDVNRRLDASDQAVRDAASQAGASSPEEGEGGVREHMLKKGDILSGGTGMSIVLLGGEARIDISGGAVVDVTEGREITSGQMMIPNHRYIAAENTEADLAVSSPAAVLSCQGGGTLEPSLTPDYFAIARTLRDLDLFRGTGSGFGEGFDLHAAPTRGEGLVMFLRLLGEEEQALACTDTHPFTDVPGWLDRYAAWAYARGYANGVSADRFGSGQKMSAVEYTEFLLRALGYSTAGVDDYTASLERALECGILTGSEYAMLREDSFCRAYVAYMSYFALETPVSGGETLGRRLTETGALTAEQLAVALARADSFRLQQAPSADTRIG